MGVGFLSLILAACSLTAPRDEDLVGSQGGASGNAGNSHSSGGRDNAGGSGKTVPGGTAGRNSGMGGGATAGGSSSFAGSGGETGGTGSGGTGGIGAQEVTGVITRISAAPDGSDANGPSLDATLTGDGELIAFTSFASNLTARDTNEVSDVFVYNRTKRETTRVSMLLDGTEPNGASSSIRINVGGQEVAFLTEAANMAHDQLEPGRPKVYSREFARNNLIPRHFTKHSSVASPSIDSIGNVVSYHTDNNVEGVDNNYYQDVYYVYENNAYALRVSVGHDGSETNGHSHSPVLDFNGATVAFSSSASNLVLNDTNDAMDVFVRHMSTDPRTTERVSISSRGEQGNNTSYLPAISGNGTKVAFCSDASNLVDGDNNNFPDVFVRDLEKKETVRVSVSSTGEEGNAGSCDPSLSADGRLVVFSSGASNLVDNDIAFIGDDNAADIFVHDTLTRKTYRISLAPKGFEPGGGSPKEIRANGQSERPRISANNEFVVFESYASNLVKNDSNKLKDVFLFQFTRAPWLVR